MSKLRKKFCFSTARQFKQKCFYSQMASCSSKFTVFKQSSRDSRYTTWNASFKDQTKRLQLHICKKITYLTNTHFDTNCKTFSAIKHFNELWKKLELRSQRQWEERKDDNTPEAHFMVLVNNATQYLSEMENNKTPTDTQKCCVSQGHQELN